LDLTWASAYWDDINRGSGRSRSTVTEQRPPADAAPFDLNSHVEGVV
jgi:hypothetical protein